MGAAATFLRSIQTSPGRLGDVGHSLLCIHLLIRTLAGTGGAEMKNHSPSHPLQLRSSCRWKNTWSRLKGRRERTHTYHSSILLFFHKCTNSFFRVLFIYLKGKGGRKRGRETSVCGCLSHGPFGDLACNPGMCPAWESNQQPFSSRAALNPLSYTSQSKSHSF